MSPAREAHITVDVQNLPMVNRLLRDQLKELATRSFVMAALLLSLGASYFLRWTNGESGWQLATAILMWVACLGSLGRGIDERLRWRRSR